MQVLGSRALTRCRRRSRAAVAAADPQVRVAQSKEQGITSAESMDLGRNKWTETPPEAKTEFAKNMIYPEVCVTGEQPALRRRKYDDDDV